MDTKQEMMELYKEFMYTKENFVDRSFATNKFYMIAITVCLLAFTICRELYHLGGSITVLAIAGAGMAFSLLLWANQDAYTYLLRVKFSAVIDKMEEQFCFKPCVEEKNAIIENAKNRRNYIFTNIQKTFALVALAVFLASFLWDFVPIIIGAFAG